MMISTGEVLKSKSGRQMSPAPRIDCTSDRKTLNTLKRVREWMKQEALLECRALKQYFAEQIINCINVLNISQSDIDTLNDILFVDIPPFAEDRDRADCH